MWLALTMLQGDVKRKKFGDAPSNQLWSPGREVTAASHQMMVSHP